MAKVALLIGVSEYELGLTSLPAAERDVQSMQRVLQHPEIGNFDEVKTLINPQTQEMAKAIETLFDGRQRDDLILLFFSGHGIKDESGKLYFST
ncbi:MAG: caspase family protein [Nostoc sp. LLA-1]|nr:caspase family protein [Cyanocohniella sp. LLY]